MGNTKIAKTNTITALSSKNSFTRSRILALCVIALLVGYGAYHYWNSSKQPQPLYDNAGVFVPISITRIPLSPPAYNPERHFNEQVFDDSMYSFSQKHQNETVDAYSLHRGKVTVVEQSEKGLTINIINSFINRPTKMFYKTMHLDNLFVFKEENGEKKEISVGDIQIGDTIEIQENTDPLVTDYNYDKALQKITIIIKDE